MQHVWRDVIASTGYFRNPDILSDQVVFVSEDDRWLVDARDGAAQHLTTWVLHRLGHQHHIEGG